MLQDALWVDRSVAQLGLARATAYGLPEGRQSAWRTAPAPRTLTAEQACAISGLGAVLRSFYAAADKLYHLGITEPKYAFVPEYLDRGKPGRVVTTSRLPRFKGILPLIMRPDLLWTSQGFIATEFDSIPGGAGLLSGMEYLYRERGFPVPSTIDALAGAFMAIHKGGVLAIIVSEESASYRAEMTYLATELCKRDIKAICLKPEQVESRSTGLYYLNQRITTLYRFFEMFDIDNVPNGWDMIEAAAKGQVKMTPPPKAYLEEKMWFALIHHPVLQAYWNKAMGESFCSRLKALIPLSFILDNRPVPPHATINNLYLGNQPVQSFGELADLPRKERSLVLKPSGYSPSAWGSRGVVLGGELTTKAWNAELERALSQFNDHPYVLQQYYPSVHEEQAFLEFPSKQILSFKGKSRYCPYFFNAGKDVLSGGVLVTCCPLEKPLIHGMTDAVMMPGIMQ